MTERQSQNWFAKFRFANFNLQDASHPGSPFEADVDKIKPLVDANRRITTQEIAERLNLSNMKRLESIAKLDIRVPRVLTERTLLRGINDCDALIRRQRNDPVLKRIVTGNEKWLVYNNVKRKKSWSKKAEPAPTTSKPDIHQKKGYVRLVRFQGNCLF